MPRHLDPVLLRAFATTARLASITAAAERLHLSQGTVSQQIRRLEDVLGERVFERDHRGVRLTPFGERALAHATRLLELNDQALHDLAHGQPRTLRLGVPPDLIRTSVPAILASFAQASPDVEVWLRSDMSPVLGEAFAQGELDLAVVEEPVADSPHERLREDALVWVGAGRGTAHASRPLRVSLVADDCAFRDAVQSALMEAGVAARFVFETGDIEATTTLVRSDLAVTAWLACTVPPDLRVLDAATGLPPLPRFAINLHRDASRGDAAVDALAQAVRRHLALTRES